MSTVFGSMLGRTVTESGHGDSSAISGLPQLLIGPYRSGKTAYLVSRIIDFCLAQPLAGALVVVPSVRSQQLLEERIRCELQQRRSEDPAMAGVAGLRIMPFYRACEYTLLRLNVAWKTLPEEVRPAVIGRILKRMKESSTLKNLLGIVDFVGMHSALLELFDELQRAAMTPGEVLESLEQTAHSDARYIELARIYEAYWQELFALGYVDERGLALLTEVSLINNKDQMPGFGLLVVDGFDRFNRLQLRVIDAIRRSCAQSILSFDYAEPNEDPQSEYLWKQSSYTELRNVFHDANQLSVQADAACNRPLSAFSAPDRQLELHEIARRAKQCLASGTKAADILVVARNLQQYRSLIEPVFDDAGLSYFIDGATELRSLPVIKFILKLLKLWSTNYPRKHVIDCLRSPYMNRKSVGFSRKDVEVLAQAAMDGSVVQGSEQWLELWSCPDLTPELKLSLEQLFASLTPPPEGSLYRFCKWVEDCLALCLTMPESSSGFLALEEERAVMELRRCLSGLVREDNILGSVDCSASYFIERLTKLVEKADFRNKAGGGGITICSADLAPNRSFEFVFVAGLLEGEFPKRAAGRGFTSPEEVEKWASFGVDIRNPRFHPDFEFALFQSLVKRARTHVFLSYPQFDTGGEEFVPSFFLTGSGEAVESCTAFAASRTRPLSTRDLLAGILWHRSFASVNSSDNPLEDTLVGTGVCGSSAGGKALPLIPEISSDLVEKVNGHICAARTRVFTAANIYSGFLGDLVATGALTVSLPQRWSATRLNDYGKCPFRYWVSHQLLVEPWQEPVDQIDTASLGQVYHLALEKFYRSMIERGLTVISAEHEVIEQLISQSISDSFAWIEAKPGVRLGEFWRYQRQDAEFRLRRFLSKEMTRAYKEREQFVPALVEAAFGLTEEGVPSFPPLQIEDGPETITIRGRIDRIDVSTLSSGSSRRVRVVDYKSGSSVISAKEAVSGRNIQLPLYALAVEQAVMPDSKAIAGVYLSVSSGEPIGKVSFRDPSVGSPNVEMEQADLRDRVYDHVRNFVRGVKCGDFSVRPTERYDCLSCRHHQICRINELMMEQSKESHAE